MAKEPKVHVRDGAITCCGLLIDGRRISGTTPFSNTVLPSQAKAKATCKTCLRKVGEPLTPRPAPSPPKSIWDRLSEED